MTRIVDCITILSLCVLSKLSKSAISHAIVPQLQLDYFTMQQLIAADYCIAVQLLSWLHKT